MMRWRHMCIHPAAHQIYIQGGCDEDFISPTSAVHMDPGLWAQEELQPLHASPPCPAWNSPCVQLTPQVNVKPTCLLKCLIFFYRALWDGGKQLKSFSFNKHLAPDHPSTLIKDTRVGKASRALRTLDTFLDIRSTSSP